MFRGGLQEKNYHCVSLLYIISKIFDYLEKRGFFWFLWPFSGMVSLVDLLTFVSDRISLQLQTRALALDVFKAFDRVWHARLFHKFTPYVVSG